MFLVLKDLVRKGHIMPGIKFFLIAVCVAQIAQAKTTRKAGIAYAEGQQFKIDGKNFNFGGVNSYLLPVKPKAQADDILANAHEMGVTLIRTWAFNVIGNPKGGSPLSLQSGVNQYTTYFHGHNGKSSIFNEGPLGLQKLDYVVQQAKKYNIKLILSLTNNWDAYGGLPQIGVWHGVTHHNDLFTNPKVTEEYQNWVKYLLNRKNSKTNVIYKDDPTIFAWEIINEVRCDNCKGNKAALNAVVQWVEKQAKFIKSIDPHHLVTVGDEGFLNDGPSAQWGYNGENGDHVALSKIPDVDFTSAHSYPDNFKQPLSWIDTRTKRLLKVAHDVNKPFMMGEFGIIDNSNNPLGSQTNRATVYETWTKQICSAGGNWVVWMLAARDAQKETDTAKDLKGLTKADEFTFYYKNAQGNVTPIGQKMKNLIQRTVSKKC